LEEGYTCEGNRVRPPPTTTLPPAVIVECLAKGWTSSGYWKFLKESEAGSSYQTTSGSTVSRGKSTQTAQSVGESFQNSVSVGVSVCAEAGAGVVVAKAKVTACASAGYSHSWSQDESNTFSKSSSFTQGESESTTIKLIPKRAGLAMWQWHFSGYNDACGATVNTKFPVYAYTESAKDPPPCFPGYCASELDPYGRCCHCTHGKQIRGAVARCPANPVQPQPISNQASNPAQPQRVKLEITLKQDNQSYPNWNRIPVQPQPQVVKIEIEVKHTHERDHETSKGGRIAKPIVLIGLVIAGLVQY